MRVRLVRLQRILLRGIIGHRRSHRCRGPSTASADEDGEALQAIVTDLLVVQDNSMYIRFKEEKTITVELRMAT